MAFWNDWMNMIADRIASRVVSLGDAQRPTVEARAYRLGLQRPQLKVQLGQKDDNISLNYTGLISARIVSQMFGKGIELDFEGDTETPQEEYINAVMDANHEEILFHRAAQAASEAGTGYLMIIPNGVVGQDGAQYPRLQLVDPLYVTMTPLPEDYEAVTKYTIEYTFTGADGQQRARRRVIEHQAPDENGQSGNTWTITDYEQDRGGRWTEVGATPWSYDFPPIIAWHNLPSVSSCYGEPDITQSLVALQDRVNYLASNISKIIRYYAHPMRIAKNIGEMKTTEIGPDQMVRITGTDADVIQLEPLGDLASSLTFLENMRQTMFATTRVTDISTQQDRLGSLTNFGLKVLYQDNLSLIGTHRELFGDMLEELVRRLLILNSMEPVDCDVKWPDFLPVNDLEVAQAIEGDLRMGIISKQSAALARGYDWDTEQERTQNEKTGEDNIGAALLRAFNGG